MIMYSNVTVTNLPKSKVEIKGAIPSEYFTKFRDKAIKNIGAELELPGFRRGFIPEKVIVQKLGEHAVHEEIAELSLREVYPAILNEHKIDAIGRPEIKITKLATGNPIEFSALTAIMPEFELPDYKSISASIFKTEEEKKEITEKQIDDAINEIRRQLYRVDKQAELTDENKGEHLPEGKEEQIAEEDLPGVDEVVQKLGKTDVASLKSHVKNELERIENLKHHEQKRGKFIEKLVGEFKAELPDILVDGEISRQESLFMAEVERAGLKFEDYLQQVGRSKDDFREEFRGPAEKQAKLQLIFDAISRRENIVPEKDRVDEEAKKIISNRPDHKLDPQAVSAYVFTTLLNEAVWAFLENEKTKNE